MKNQEAPITFVGTLEKIIYANSDVGFLIGLFRTETNSQSLTVKGSIFNVEENDVLQIKGRWENHKVYGKQFHVLEFMPVLPQSILGIERYLASGVFKGIGKTTAKKIVSKFGDKTFDIIDKSPEKLLSISRFTKKQLQAVIESHEENKGLREVMSFLHGLEISQSYAQKIFHKYGLSSISRIQDNPYQITEITGIGFLIADSIARKTGFDKDSIERAIAGLLYTFDQLVAQGHTCFPGNDLILQTSENLDISPSSLEKAAEQLYKEHYLLKRKTRTQHDSGNQLVTTPLFYKAEQQIVENLLRILESEAFTVFENHGSLIRQKEEKIGIKLHPIQKEAIQAALENKVLIITGGAWNRKNHNY